MGHSLSVNNVELKVIVRQNYYDIEITAWNAKKTVCEVVGSQKFSAAVILILRGQNY